jgi:hypothetical protein
MPPFPMDYPYPSPWYRSEWARIQYAEGTAYALLGLLDARNVRMSGTERATIATCRDQHQLDYWIWKSATADRLKDLGDPFAA